jgi:hypothetical protein
VSTFTNFPALTPAPIVNKSPGESVVVVVESAYIVKADTATYWSVANISPSKLKTPTPRSDVFLLSDKSLIQWCQSCCQGFRVDLKLNFQISCQRS